jgi:hypothetical protein
MRDFGVLEQDILIGDFARACRDAGFQDVRVKPLSYTVPAFDLTLEQWEAWSRLAASKRPLRALQKMGRAVAEFLGVGKRGPLFEETFGISLVRTLRHAMEDHPIIVASKVPAARGPDGPQWSAAIVVTVPARVVPGCALPVRATLTNHGVSTWPAISRSGTGHVTLGVQLLDGNARLLARDHYRVSLPSDVLPGSTVTLAFDCPAPEASGAYMLKFDLVAEGVTWFETTGSPAVTRALTVE